MSTFSDFLCPDCGAAFGPDGNMVHDDSCPLAAAEDACQDRDREFFERYPEASEVYRPVDPSEVAFLRALAGAPDDWLVVGRTRVVRIGPGVRARDWRHVVFVAPGVTAR